MDENVALRFIAHCNKNVGTGLVPVRSNVAVRFIAPNVGRAFSPVKKGGKNEIINKF
jgi:hypothetical protein